LHSADNAGKKTPAHPPYACWVDARESDERAAARWNR
jgi:hypothetical protein